MLVLPANLRYPEKNQLYVGQNPTPNEMWRELSPIGTCHRKHIKQWYRENNLPHPPKRWFEVRVVNFYSDATERGMWWESPLFMDKVFWVDQKPYSEMVGGQLVQFYILDFYECQRVRGILMEEQGQEPFVKDDPSLLIPISCTQICWEETSAGTSEHIRDRGYRELSPEQKIAEEIEMEAIEEASKRIINLDPEDVHFQIDDKGIAKIIGD